MRLTTLSLLAAHVAAAVPLLAQTGSMAVKHAPPTPASTPARAAAVAAAPALAAARAPEIQPPRLDFPALWNGEAKKLTVRFASPAAGTVSAKLSDRNFRVTELRAMGGGLMTGGGPVAARLPSGSPVTREPFEKSVAEGQEVQVDVVFEPKFSLDNVAGPKTATLVLAGPGAPTSWRVDVPVAGRFEGIKLSLVFKTDGDTFDVVEPDNQFQVPVSLLGFGHTVQGRFRLKSAPNGFLMDEKTFSVPPGGTARTTLTFHLAGIWLGNGAYRPGGEVRVVFEYEGKSSEVVFTVRPHVKMLEIRTISVGAADRPGCDALRVEGFVHLMSDGSIQMNLQWVPPSSWSPSSSTTVYFAAFFKGRAYAEGYFPKIYQSAIYSKSWSARQFRTTFTKQDYLPMVLAFGSGRDFTFQCGVSQMTHF